MKFILLSLSLLVSYTAFADPVTINFTPPTEYVDDTPLADSEITQYKWDAYGAANTIKDMVFANTGNMTSVTIDLPKDKYLICL